MADTIELRVDTRELEAALKALPDKLARLAAGRALQAAGDVMLEAVVAHTPERTDEITPEQTSLPPGILKADMHTEIQFSRAKGWAAVKVGPSKDIGGLVAYRQNNGWVLTAHGGKQKYGEKQIRPIAGKHFLEAAFDESIEVATAVFLDTLADQLFGLEEGNDAPENRSFDVEFD
jgi:hypothetical protein